MMNTAHKKVQTSAVPPGLRHTGYSQKELGLALEFIEKAGRCEE